LTAPKTAIDHLVVTCRNLQTGRLWLEQRFGVPFSNGGKHVTMGTHNALLRIGRRAYLEIIAIDPEAPTPPHPRWFSLDREEMRAEPRLVTWMLATPAISVTLQKSPFDVGCIQPFQRNTLQWKLTVRDDGALVEGGVWPAFIQWDGAHPCDTLPDQGVSLVALDIRHPDPARIEEALKTIDFESGEYDVTVSQGASPKLEARFATPSGEVRL
jgi:hypothetical protein